MGVSKEDTYNRARQLLDQEIKTSQKFLRETLYLQENYPKDIRGDDLSVECSQGDVDQDIVDINRRRLDLIWKINHVREDVENMVSEIYNMSEVRMSDEKLQEFAQLIHAFMRITGEPWIMGSLQKTKFGDFLCKTWNKDMIPVNREAVWTKIPTIYAHFMHTVNPERANDRRLHRFT